MKCSLCNGEFSMGIKKDGVHYCFGCGREYVPIESSKTKETSYMKLIENGMVVHHLHTQSFLRTFDVEILAELSEKDWNSQTIIEDCMDIVLERVFPTLSLDDVFYIFKNNILEITLPGYWYNKAKNSEEILDYVTGIIHWKRR